MAKGYEELNNIINNKELLDSINETCVQYWKYLYNNKNIDYNLSSNFFIKDEYNKLIFLDDIEKILYPLDGKSILDIGCGKGTIVISCAIRGANSVGIDIDTKELNIADKRINSQSIKNIKILDSSADKLPFSDESFDLVLSTSVLEHVKNCESVISEIARVTKVNGYCCIISPNPRFPREGHYKLFWIPYMPKIIGKYYIKLKNYNPHFFLNYVTYPYPSITQIEKYLEKNNMSVCNWTEKTIIEKFNNPVEIKGKSLKYIILILKHLHMNNLFAKFIISIKFYPNALIIAQRREKC